MAQCQYYAGSSNYTLRDSRDNNTYTVRYISGACWMTQNLRIAGGTTLNSSTSNVSSSFTLPTDSTAFDSGSIPFVHYSGNTTTGSWYNLCAATAGTSCKTPPDQDAIYDICPKGWSLPTQVQADIFRVSSYASVFSPVFGGYYTSFGIDSSSSSFWTSTKTTWGQCNLYYNGNTLWTSANFSPSYGSYVRCLRSS